MSAHTRKTMLLATDQQQSVLNTLAGNGPRSIAYTPYGHRSPENGLLSLIGFNGEPPDALTGHYHLGNGYRQFNPVLMRFNSPDSWSPFGDGGLNAYAYCGGEPRNRTDSTGHFWGIGKALRSFFGLKPKRSKTAAVPKNVSMGGNSPGKNGPTGSHQTKDLRTDINAFTPKDIEYQAAEFRKFEQTKRWNELVSADHKTRIHQLTAAQAPTRSPDILQRYAKDPVGSLAHLERSKNNVLERLASDSPTNKAKREALLKVIEVDIVDLRKTVNSIRNSNSTLSI